MVASPIVAFYRGQGNDHRGRTLPQIWSFSRAALGDTHDYIQWLFPLTERSAFNPYAPVLTPADIATFRAEAMIQAHLGRSLRVMLHFYGFTPEVAAAPDFAERAAVWLTPHNHNFLRLTRILKSLRLLGREADADALRTALELLARDHFRIIGPDTLSFWRDS
ncbi:MAG: opioid growth factor receptor-related protein [Bryobacter sp.]|nr:opioid growth factor receptor-related protein [Bryobacter sp.]